MPRYAARLATAIVVTAAVTGLAACGGSNSYSGGSKATTSTPAAPAAPAAAAGKSAVALSADPSGALKFNTNKLSAKSGTVTVAMKNPASSGVAHGIAVEGNGVDQDGKTVQPGGTSTDTVKLKPGTYTYYCPVPGHKAAGMQGTLVVK
jgi:plastocyanin